MGIHGVVTICCRKDRARAVTRVARRASPKAATLEWKKRGAAEGLSGASMLANKSDHRWIGLALLIIDHGRMIAPPTVMIAAPPATFTVPVAVPVAPSN